VIAATAIVLLAAALVATTASPSVSEQAPRRQVADCERGPVTDGPGPPNWRRRSIVAGPVTVLRDPLGRMMETASGQLTAKMPILVAGHTPVTVAVPERARHRVFLYYGRMTDRRGRPTTIIGRAAGFWEVHFEPCTDRPRTVWPGGIRVAGRAPVRLEVRVDGRAGTASLPLGRPRVFSPG
jgi:hypothetical protein